MGHILRVSKILTKSIEKTEMGMRKGYCAKTQKGHSQLAMVALIPKRLGKEEIRVNLKNSKYSKNISIKYISLFLSLKWMGYLNRMETT